MPPLMNKSWNLKKSFEIDKKINVMIQMKLIKRSI